MNPRFAKIGKWIGYPLYALTIFFVMIYITFPYEQVKQVLESKLSTAQRTVKIGSLSARPLLGLSASDVLVTIRPKPKARTRVPLPGRPVAAAPSGEKPKVHRLRLEKASVSVGLLALLGGGVSASFSVDGFGGTLSGSYEMERKGKRVKRWGLELEVEGISAKEVPQLQALGPPLAGTLSGKVKIEAPGGRLAAASGEVDLELANTVLGDNKAKIKIKGNPMLAMGVTLPKVRLGRIGIKLDIKKGKISFQRVGARSKDVELKVEGSISLRKPLAFSVVRTYVLIKTSPSLKKRDSKFELLEGALGKAKRPDGFMGLMISGILRGPRVTPSKVGFGKRRMRGRRPGMRATPARRMRTRPRRR